MKTSFKKSAMFLLTLLVLVFSALGTTPAYATWVFKNKTQATNGLGSDTVKGVFVNGSTVYVATIGGLSISLDGGNTFSTKTSASNGLGVDTVNGVFESAGTIYAATNVGLSISANGGTSFNNRIQANSPGLGNNKINGVFVSAGTIYAATDGGLSISTNGGTSFSNKTLATNFLGSDTVFGVFVSGTTIYAATNGGLSISTDGGTTFSNKTTTDGLGSNAVNAVVESAGTIYAATDNGLSISTDGGTLFTNRHSSTTPGFVNNTVKGVFVSGTNVYAATLNGLAISTDGGATFTNKTTANGLGSNGVRGGVFVSGNTVYAGTQPVPVVGGVGGGLSIGADDVTGPTINSFTATSPIANLNIPITAFTASDEYGVAGYLITESATPPAVGAAGWTVTAPTIYTAAGNGSYTLYPWAKDVVGNVSPVYGSPVSVIVDTIAPDTNIDSQPSNPNNDTTPTFSFSGNDGAGSGVASFMCKMDDGSFAACTNPFTSPALLDGSHTFYVYATDNAANADLTPDSYTWTLESVAPETSIGTKPSNPNNNNTPGFTFSGDDGAGTGIASFQCQMDAGSYAVCTSPFTSPLLTDSSHTFNVKAIDVAGNEDASPATYTWVVDSTAPETSIDNQPSNPDTNNSTPTFEFSGTDATSGVASFMCRMDAGSFAACTSPFVSSTLADGSHTFDVKAIDSAGNEDPTPDSYTWVIDALAPTVSSIVRANPDNTSAASVNFTVVFSKPVTGVDTADFSLTTPVVSGATVSLVSGSDATYTVTVLTGSGNGTIRLDVPNTASIVGVNGHAIATLPYTGGESYTINKGVVTPPSVPVLASPVNNELITDFTPFLDWGSSSMAAGTIFDYYQLNVATDAAFTSLITDVKINGISNSLYTIPSNLAANTVHYWRVRAVNLAGGSSNWSAVRTFRTIVDAATLVSPVEGFNSLSVRPSFDWSDVAGPGAVTGYTIQISKNNIFTMIIHTGSSVASNYVPTADLPKNLQLFWRVQTKGANGPSAWSAVRSFNSANSPTTPALSLPAANALLINYTPLFKWTAATLPVGTAFKYYQIQVDDAADFSSPVIDDTSITNPATTQFQVVSPLAHNTKFYWRVRAFNMDNEESNWSAVRYFRTLVDATTLVSPVEGFNASSLRPSFDWDDVTGPAGVTGYTIQISKNNTFTLIVHTGSSVASNYVPTADLPKNLQLFWRVQTKGANGPSAWSAVRSFNSANSPTTPVLSLPAANALLTNYTPLFKWSAVTLPVGTSFKWYQLQVSDNANFSSPVIDDTSITDRVITQFQVVSPLAHNTKFYWRVRALNTDDEEGTWSAVRYFRTLVDAPVLVAPGNGSDPSSLRPAFDWNDVTGPAGVTGYTIQISKNNTFTQVVHTGSPVASSYVPTADLPKNLPLFWRVQTKGANGPSAWSDWWTFVSANSPTTPALSLPAANALLTNYTPLFKWTAVTLPVGTAFKYYQIQVDDAADFSSPVIDDTSITDRVITQFQVGSPLAHNTKFYWRVRAFNMDDDESNWSAVRYFRTLVDAPVLSSPANGATVGSLVPVFDWDNAVGPGAVTNYTINVSASPTFATLLVNKNVVTSTYTQLTNLPANKTLYWRVRVNGANGLSAWSSVFSFITP